MFLAFIYNRGAINRMKVLYISNEAALGGAAQSLIDMLKEIQRYIDPIVIIPEKGIIEEKLVELEIPYHVISFSMGHSVIGKYTNNEVEKNFIDNYEAALKLVSIIKEEKIDLIHTNSSVSNVGEFASLMTGVPHVWHIRELLEEHYGREFLDKELKLHLLQSANEIISISDCVKSTFENKYGIQSVRLYNGLNLEKYKKDYEYSEKNRNDSSTYNFLVVGTISYDKGQLDIVKAFAELISEGITNIHLTIVGPPDAQYVWLLKQYIIHYNLEAYIQIYSFRDDLSLLRSQTDFSITSSKMEALGRATLEAMLAGNITIGANKGGTAEIIGVNQERGYLYEQGNYISLANVLKTVISENGERKAECREKARSFVIDNFDSKKYVQELLKIYRRVLATPFKKNQMLAERIQSRYVELKKSCTQLSVVNSNQEKKAWRMFQYSQKWLHIVQKQESIASYFELKNWRNIAIYGMGYFGCSLFDELRNSSINIRYCIDKNFICDNQIVTIKSSEDELSGVDVIVVTVSVEEMKIIEWLKKKHGFPVISLLQIIDSYQL